MGRHDRLPDQTAALTGLLAAAETQRPDLIIHSGDLFDSTRPPYPAMQLGTRALARLSAIAPTVVIAGNHDSQALFRVLHGMAGMVEPRRLWFVDAPRVLEIPQLGDGFALACVPFIAPTLIAGLSVVDLARMEGTYADGIRQLNTHLLNEAVEIAGNRGIVTYAAHLHVNGARPSKSERTITIGDDYATHVDTLGRAMYSAFGHIHDPQLLPGGIVTGRYAGSLIPIDFGERTQTKHTVVVELGDRVEVRQIDLPPGRELFQFEGSMEQLEEKAESGQLNGVLLKGRVLSTDPILDLADRIANLAPGCAIFDLANVVARQPVKAITSDGSTDDEPPLDALFAQWRSVAASRTATRAPDEAVVARFRQMLAGGGDDPDLGAGLVVEAAEVALRSFRSDGT